MIKRLLYGWIILFLVLGAIGYVFYQQSVPAVDNQEPDFRVAAVDLVIAFQVDEQAANQRYLGKLLEVRGAVNLFNAEQGVVYLGEPTAAASVSCAMDQKDALLGFPLSAGDSISVKGICTGYLMDVQLNRASIVP